VQRFSSDDQLLWTLRSQIGFGMVGNPEVDNPDPKGPVPKTSDLPSYFEVPQAIVLSSSLKLNAVTRF
jgi:hypothetical protein